MKFIPADFEKDEENFAVLGGGCFWCLDAFFREMPGVKEVVVGYAGGDAINPSYEDVSTGKTGHAEVVKVVFDQNKTSYEKVLESFFKMHDPTTLNRQGGDIGEQYRSIILYATWKQRIVTKKFIDRLQKGKIYKGKIVTELVLLYSFYEAEEYHQDYFAKNPESAYCQAHIVPKLEKLKKEPPFVIPSGVEGSLQGFDL